MSDTFRSDLIDVNFVAGEQPFHTKLTGMTTQLKTAVNKLSLAIGDLFTEQTHPGGGTTYTLEDVPTVGPNLSRMLGSAGWLNPRQQGRIRQIFEVIFTGGTPSTTLNDIHFRRRYFKLPFPAILFKRDGQYEDAPEGTDVWAADGPVFSQFLFGPSYNDSNWSIDPAGSTYTDVVSAGPKQKVAVASQVASLEDLDTAGEWYCDYEEGAIYLASGLYGDSGIGDTIGGAAPNMTLTDASASFPTDVVGCSITIAGATTPANNGTFSVTTRNSSTQIVYTNASGVAEPLGSGTWSMVEAFKLTYQCDTFSDSYDGATFNVIPDFAQSTPLCTVSLISGSTYQIVTPNARESRGRHGVWTGVTLDNDLYFSDQADEILSSYTEITPTDNPLGSYQIELPRALRENLSSGDTIPSGYIQIWDDTNQIILLGGTFTYVDENTVQCTGLNLTVGSSKYRLIVPGTNTMATLYHLRDGYFNHCHTGKYNPYDLRFDGHRVSHAELTHLFDEGDFGNSSPGFVPSSIGPTRNPHPMYFHRYGYKYANSISDSGNLENALLGDLVIGNIDGVLDTTADSWSIYFAGFEGSAGGEIKYDQSDDTLRVSRKALEIDEGLFLPDGVLTFNDASTGTKPTSGASIVKDSLYAKNVVHAWIRLSYDGAGTFTIYDSFGVDTTNCGFYGAGNFEITFQHAMTGENCTQITPVPVSLNNFAGGYTTIDTSSIEVELFKWSAGAVSSVNQQSGGTSGGFSVVVFGKTA